MFGKAVLGDKDYAKQKASAPQGIGAAVAFGKKVMGKGANAVPLATPATPTIPLAPAKAAAKGGAKKKPVHLSEADVIEILTTDPSRWQEQLAIEAARKDGPRNAVLTLMLDQADKTDPPMPDEYRVEMRRLLGIEEGESTPAADTPPAE